MERPDFEIKENLRLPKVTLKFLVFLEGMFVVSKSIKLQGENTAGSSLGELKPPYYNTSSTYKLPSKGKAQTLKSAWNFRSLRTLFS